jgi:lipopolysaccharide cholinephosphotransferase
MTTSPKELSLEEKRKIQMQMLDEVDAFCKKNHLRYSLAYGTLLGAIRHKGFIPWDDDMDIMMPLPDMEIFKKTFHSENVRISDIDTNKDYQYPFPRLVHKHTYSQEGLTYRGDGVCIDTYPIVGLPDEQSDIEAFFSKAKRLLKVRLFFSRARSWVLRHSSYNYFPITRFFQKKYRDYLYQFKYRENGTYFATPNLRWKHVFHVNLFEKTMDVPFEDHTYSIICAYETFLRQRYDDYMELPPVEERVPFHEFHCYWNEDHRHPQDSTGNDNKEQMT